jgi:hypothetical protein
LESEKKEEREGLTAKVVTGVIDLRRRKIYYERKERRRNR